ncbi:MAG: hypothetical protein M1827_000501 [Pycnora praestabilis]|nr:MAG: hypothetical protein M1827_000501 [Pycnora praestabilis]
MDSEISQDPLDWSVDQVMFALCDPTSKWFPVSAGSIRPEPTTFKRVLRDNDVNGHVLLTTVDNSALRDDLGLRSLGQRGIAMQAIQRIRSRSPKYLEYIQEVAAQTPLPSTNYGMSPGYGFGSPLPTYPTFSSTYGTLRANGNHSSRISSPMTMQYGRLSIPLQEVPKDLRLTQSTGSIGHPAIQPLDSVFMRPEHRRLRETTSKFRPETANFSTAESTEQRPSNSDTENPSDKQQGFPHIENHPVHFPLDAQSEQRDTVSSSVKVSSITDWGNGSREGEGYIMDDSGRKRRKLTLRMNHEPFINKTQPPQTSEDAVPLVSEKIPTDDNTEIYWFDDDDERVTTEDHATISMEDEGFVDIDNILDPSPDLIPKTDIHGEDPRLYTMDDEEINQDDLETDTIPSSVLGQELDRGDAVNNSSNQLRLSRHEPLSTKKTYDDGSNLSLRNSTSAATMHHHPSQEVMTDNQGRKRLAPTLVYQAEHAPLQVALIGGASLDLSNNEKVVDDILNTEIPFQRVENRSQTQKRGRGYLGPEKFSIDEVFYGKTPIGQDLRNDVSYQPLMEAKTSTNLEDNFFFSSDVDLPTGRRLYVNTILKSFLVYSQPNRKIIRRGGKYYSAIVPYASKYGTNHDPQSFTLFSASSEVVVTATREDLSKWPELMDSPVPNNVKKKDLTSNFAHFNVPENNPFMLLKGDNTNHDWDFLRKWDYEDGASQILPGKLGESGSEGEYDLQTWKEIEAENKGIKKLKSKTRSQRLNSDEIETAIDMGIETLIDKWKMTELPQLKRTAWRIWKNSQRDQSKRTRIHEAREHVDRINREPLPKMRREIAREYWSTTLQVIKQCRIMEQTIYNRETLLWEIAVLKNKSEPPRPAPRDKKRRDKVVRLQETSEADGESLESQTRSQMSSDDELAGFIIDDTSESGLAEDKLGMATGDADDEEAMDISEEEIEDSEDEIVTPASRRKRKHMGELISPSRYSIINEKVHPAQSSESPPMGMIKKDVSSYTMSVDGLDVSPSTVIGKRAIPPIIPAILSYDNGPLSSAPTLSPTFTLSPTRKSPNNVPQNSTFVDLTGSTDQSGPEQPPIGSRFFVRTPSIDPSDGRPYWNPFMDSNKPKAIKTEIPSTAEVIDLASLSSGFSSTGEGLVNSDDEDMPAYTEMEKIRVIPWKQLEKRFDRKRLLIKLITRMDHEAQTNYEKREDLERMVARTLTLRTQELWCEVYDALRAFRDNETNLKGLSPDDHDTFEDLMRIASLYLCWKECMRRKPKRGFPENLIMDTLNDKKGFMPFHSFLQQVLKQLPVKDTKEHLPTNITPTRSILRKSQSEKSSTDNDSDAPTKQIRDSSKPQKRKRFVQDNKAARSIRTNDQQRVKEQEMRRHQLQPMMERIGVNTDTGRIIVNFMKSGDEDFIFINPHVARRIKKHQIEGVQFMWRELVTDVTAQGCLLAHTMGLGKTMQVITLLLTIAETSMSSNLRISGQIPKGLRQSRTLILCPPSLIDNWWDEFLIWAPAPWEAHIGQLRKVDTLLSREQRLREVDAWYDEGGILLLSYEMFRSYISNKGTKTQAPPLDEDQHRQVRSRLLEGPHIIVADEAHKMKNRMSAISTAASQFTSRSRIALTGSPLANSLEEYYAMINWVAPGYLGDSVQFRARYVEPIQEGLYYDSTPSEKRTSLKMLRVLKQDLDPKINRADITVLKGSLKPKIEFVIKVPLTKLQKEAYRLYVDHLLKGDTSKVGHTRLWDWLAILSLLCNHPLCFKDKLVARGEQAQEAVTDGHRPKAQSRNVSEDEGAEDLPGDAPVSKLGLSRAMIDAQLNLFAQVEARLDSVMFSNKVGIFAQIVDMSIKAGDKILVFSHTLPTLDFLENFFIMTSRRYSRLDGTTKMSERQFSTKKFNTGNTEIYLVSTRAGGLGLNLFGANRVIIFDFGFNPVWEEQAVGRAYRIGQLKPVFVYRFIAGGTFEDVVYNKAVFKTQLASRVVDQRNPIRHAGRNVRDYLFEPRVVEQEDLKDFEGKDPKVLDQVLATSNHNIRSIQLTETFQCEDDDNLTPEEEKEAAQMLKDQQLQRSDPQAYQAVLEARRRSASQLLEKKRAEAMPYAQQNVNHDQSSTQAAVRTKQQILPSAMGISQPIPASESSNTVLGFDPASGSGLAPIAGTNTKIRAPSLPPLMGMASNHPNQILKPRLEVDANIPTVGIRREDPRPPKGILGTGPSRAVQDLGAPTNTMLPRPIQEASTPRSGLSPISSIHMPPSETGRKKIASRLSEILENRIPADLRSGLYTLENDEVSSDIISSLASRIVSILTDIRTASHILIKTIIRMYDLISRDSKFRTTLVHVRSRPEALRILVLNSVAHLSRPGPGLSPQVGLNSISSPSITNTNMNNQEDLPNPLTMPSTTSNTEQEITGAPL